MCLVIGDFPVIFMLTLFQRKQQALGVVRLEVDRQRYILVLTSPIIWTALVTWHQDRDIAALGSQTLIVG